jgi:hypothetical protein
VSIYDGKQDMTKFYLKTQFSENINVYNGALERFCETRK